MTPERFAKLKKVLDQRQPDLTVVADKIHKGRNIAAIVRTCDAVGISEIHSVVPEAGYKPYRGTTMGAQKWVDVHLYDTVSQPLSDLRRKGFQLVATCFSERAIDFREVDYCRPTALILGSEIKGVSNDAIDAETIEVTIPMLGMVQSYNVSVAASIILSEAQRQRMAAGMYEQSRLDKDVYKKTLFRWAQPAVAEYCDKHGRPYPELLDDGAVDASVFRNP